MNALLSRPTLRHINFLRIVTILHLILYSSAAWSIDYPTLPSQESHISDEVELFQDQDKAKIDLIASEIESKFSIPIKIVIISSLANYQAKDFSIENYSRRLFDHWGIGTAQNNLGILLLVSKEDRKARIQLGGDWGHDYDAHAERIMYEVLIPAFKRGEFSLGVHDTVVELAAMVDSKLNTESAGLYIQSKADRKMENSEYLQFLVDIYDRLSIDEFKLIYIVSFFLLLVNLIGVVDFVSNGRKGAGWIFFLFELSIICLIVGLIVILMFISIRVLMTIIFTPLVLAALYYIIKDLISGSGSWSSTSSSNEFSSSWSKSSSSSWSSSNSSSSSSWSSSTSDFSGGSSSGGGGSSGSW